MIHNSYRNNQTQKFQSVYIHIQFHIQSSLQYTVISYFPFLLTKLQGFLVG